MSGTRLALLLLALAAPVVTAACADSNNEGRLRKERWIDRADERCEDEKDALGELEAPDADPFDVTLTSEQLAEIATYLDASLRIQDDLTDDLDDLDLPAEDSGDIETVLEHREEGAAAVGRAIDAAERGDAETFVLRYREAATAYSKASQKARDFGLEECGQP
jgi:hypothetical protein